MKITRLIYTIPTLLVGINFAQAQTCTNSPSCAELGFTKSAAQCSGKSMVKCPFDQTKVACEDNVIITCDNLGFTDNVAECPGTYTKCPTDISKGKCDFEASPGDLKYSLRTSNHNGWLLCNGASYSSSQYPELYAAISGSYPSNLPNYSGSFLKAGATSYAYNFSYREEAGLPNIYASGLRMDDEMQGSLYGAWYRSSSVGYDAKSSLSGSGWYLSFDASRYNSIYGRSYTVTPQNYTANVFIYSGRKKY